MKIIKGFVAFVLSFIACGLVMWVGDIIATWLAQTSIMSKIFSIHDLVALTILFLFSVTIYRISYKAGLLVCSLISKSLLVSVLYCIMFVVWMVSSAWISMRNGNHFTLSIAMIIVAITAITHAVLLIHEYKSEKALQNPEDNPYEEHS